MNHPISALGPTPCKPKPTHPQDLALAAAAGWGKEFLVAVLTVHGALLLHEADVSQRGAAVGAVELLRVPRLPHGHQEGPSVGTHTHHIVRYYEFVQYKSSSDRTDLK